MANSLGSTVEPKIISQTFMAAFQAEAAPLAVMTTDLSDEIATKGGYVTTRIPAALTAGSKDVSGSFTSSDVSITEVDVRLINWNYVQFELSEMDMAKSMVNLEKTFIIPAAKALAFAMEDKAFALITNANYSNSSTYAPSSFNYNAVVDIEAAVDVLGYSSDKALVLPSDYLAALRKDSAVKDSFRSEVNDAVVSGKVGKLAGFEVYKSNRIPSNSESLEGFAVDPRGIAIASRVLPPASKTKGSQTIEKLENGFAVRFTTYYNEEKGVYVFRWDHVFGVAKGDAKGVYRIKSA